jgi:voltage-gated potassium channel
VKFLFAQLLMLMQQRPVRHNARVLGLFLLSLAAMVVAYTALFHAIMELEGQEFSWISGLYWTLTVMSTLGFGDITFQSDLGRLFSMVVLVSGTIFLLVLFPFIVIQFFWAPWMEAQAAARAPREVDEDVRGHVILTNFDEITAALVERLDRQGDPYVLLVPDREEAIRYHDLGLRVMVGSLDDPETYRRAGVERAVLVATTGNDFANSSVAFTVRGVAPDVPIISTADDPASVDVLELAGSTHVVQLPEELGRALARRTIGADAMTHTIGEMGPLVIAEAIAARTPICGKTLAESRLRATTGVNVVGMWERGTFLAPGPESVITPHTALVLAGTREQLYRYDELFVIYNMSAAPVLVLGGGRVGQAAGRALGEGEIDYRIVEKNPELIRDPLHHVLGSAAELEVLEKAGIMETPTVLITTNNDDLNVYLTIYCRKLRPDVQIITRVTADRNVSNLHRAGADFVMSYASMGASAMVNLMKRSEVLMLAEGLDLFKVKVPPSLAGKTVAEAGIRERSKVVLFSLASFPT